MRSNIRNRHDADHYDQYSSSRMGPWDELFIARAVALCPPVGTDPLVVDVGTGSGVIPTRLARLPIFAAHRFVGLEYFDDMVERGRQRVVDEALVDRVAIEKGDAHSLPLPDDCVDLILSRATIHHLADPVLALREKYRVLRSGGVALIHDARRDAPAPVLEMFNKMRAEVGYEPTTLGEKYTAAEAEALLAQAGLSEVSSVYVGTEGLGAIGFEIAIRKP